MAAATAMMRFKEVSQSGLGAPLLMIMMLAMIIVPIHPFILDMFFTFNIILSMVVLMVTVYALRPLDFGIFPTVLLVTTLLRLALNVASTRVVLLEGHTGSAAAGKVIESFGEFVVGGNYAVGLVVFAILVIINFVVVTKGAGRVSEVSARFTLDAMPGKQMAIDADMNAGVLTQEEARQRREDVAREADFYGAMDGASKFVRGDAIAGILILFINIIGGLFIGTLQFGLDISEAMHNYTLLTIGDGLVAQLPSLVLSTATAIIVTRVSSKQLMSEQIMTQMFENPMVLAVSGGAIGLLGLIPGMPNFAFLSLALLAGLGAWKAWKKQQQPEPQTDIDDITPEEVPTENKDLSWDDVAALDVIGLEVGYRLIPLIDRNQGGQMMDRIKGVRKKLSQEMGFLFHPVHIKDNLELSPTTYRILLMGVPVGEAEIFPDRELAINPGRVFGKLEGIEAKDPAFNLDAIWINISDRDNAQSLGYTVVDASTVVATHLSQVLQSHAHELLGHEEVQQLLDALAEKSAKLVEELVPGVLTVSQILKVLQNLLQEGVPIRDMRTIAETLAAQAQKSRDSGDMTAAVRISLGRQIIQNINGIADEVEVITLDPALEHLLQQGVQSVNQGEPGIEPGLAERMHRSLAETVQRQEASGRASILLVIPLIRPWLSRMVRHSIPDLSVLSYNEIPDNKQIKVIANIGQELPAPDENETVTEQ
ncbi:MAG: flagellar biosynthesis protein FlhA [Gammaproteobacteria bacterium]